MADHLTALDATFLELEEADQGAHMHIGAVMIFDPPARGRPPTVEDLCADLEPRLDGLPRYRERLSSTATGGLSWPSWEGSDRFDIRSHVRRAVLPAPGGEDDLLEWAGDYFSQRLERTQPLWEIVLLEGLADGRWALVNKTHHCMVDGVGAVDVTHVLLDADAGAERHEQAPPRSSPAPPVLPEAVGSMTRSATSAAAGLVKLPLRGIRAGAGFLGVGAGAVRHPGRLADAARRAQAMADVIVHDELNAAPRSSINVPIGGRRRLAVSWVPLTELKYVKDGLGGTLNDVVLALATGGLRTLLLSRGESLPTAGLRAMVPVNLRSTSEQLALGNKVTSLFVRLPVGEPDPRRRFEAQREQSEAAKSGSQALGSSTMIDFTAHAPPAVHSFIARSMYATRLFNLTVTNVPGPRSTLYCFGSRMTDAWPLVPLAADHALGMAVLSYDGKVFFSINADRDAMPDLGVLAGGIENTLAELHELAGGDRAADAR